MDALPLPGTRDFLSRLVENANRLAERGLDTEGLRRLIETTDLVFGIWQDAAEPFGVDWTIIKGKPDLEALAAQAKITVPRRTYAAIPCRCYEEALAMCRVLGDARN